MSTDSNIMSWSELEIEVGQLLGSKGFSATEIIGFLMFYKGDEKELSSLVKHLKHSQEDRNDIMQRFARYIIYKYQLENNDVVSFPLYHGTDARIVRMSKEGRKSFREDCLLAINYIWQFFLGSQIVENQHNTVNYKVLESFKENLDNADPGLFVNLMDALAMNGYRLNGSNLYRYDEGCVNLASENSAKSYAFRSFAFGEIGLMAYRMIQSLDVMCFEEWDPDRSVQNAIDRIKQFAEDTPQPVIIPMTGLRIRDLEAENGSPVEEMVMAGIFKERFDHKVRYNKDVELTLENAIYLDK